MPPTTTRRPTEGQMAASRIAAVRGMVNQGVSTPDARAELRRPISELPNQSGQRTGFTVPMPESVPSEALNGNFSITDVRAQRDNRAQADLATNQFNSDFDALTGRINNTKLDSPFTNPEATLNRLLLRGTTDTQAQLDAQRGTQADTIRGFAGELTKTGQDARTQFGIPELQTNLAETRNRIAERQVQLRETLRDFETNAERRGVAREFVDSEKRNVQAQAATELADLSIIESAQLGNLNEARKEVDDLLAEKKQAFEFENMAIEAEIARLDKMDTRESQARSEQLQIALTERTRNIETALANEKEQREYLVQAASEGADQGTLMAIRNAKSPEEAAFLASPFIGKTARAQAAANIANIYDQINSRGVSAREAVLKAATEEEKVKAEKVADSEQALEIATLATQLAEASGMSSAVGFGLKKNPVSRFIAGAATGAGAGAAGGSLLGPLGTVVGGIGGAIAGGIGGVSVGGDAVAGTSRANFEAQATRLGNLLTLDNLSLMKGVLTDRDIQLLATAGSNLLNFDMSEAAYQQEIKRVTDLMNRTIQNNGITPEQAQYYGIIEEQDIPTLDAIWNNL